MMTPFRKAGVNSLPAVTSPQMMRLEVHGNSLNILNLKKEKRNAKG